MKRKGARSIKRLFVRASLFILAGAIINVAVAWGCVTTQDGAKCQEFVLWTPPMIGLRLRAGILEVGYGNSARGIARFAERVDERQFRTMVPSGLFLGPGDSWQHKMKELPASKALRFMTETAAGWPHYSIHASRVEIDGQTGQEIESHGVLRLPQWMVTAYSPDLPIAPLWPGFAINTVFYAAILWGVWLLFTAPGFVRRRIRIKRGLCPACAYPVGASNVCTECGAPVRVQNS